MNRSPVLSAAALAIWSACALNDGPAVSEGVRPAVLEWQVGVNEKEGPTAMVETILPATHAGKAVWRVVHRDPDPTGGDGESFDMYDVDRESLVPVRSVMRREGLALTLAFDGERVAIERSDGNEKQTTEVRVRNPMPEGPGTRVLLAALPLRPGYATEFPVVDRWAKNEASRVQTVDLRVAGPRAIDTRLGRCDTLEVTLATRDGLSSSKHWVRAAAPRYPFRIEYTRGGTTLVSEVTRMAVEGVAVDCSASPSP